MNRLDINKDIDIREVNGIKDPFFGHGRMRFKSGGSTKVQQAPRFTKSQESLFNQLIGGLRPLVGQALTPLGEQQFAPISPLMQQAFAGFGGLADIGGQALDFAQQGLGGIAGDFLGTAQQALETGLGGFDASRIMEALRPGQELAQRTFERSTIPMLLERFGATSGGSGALNTALAEAGADLSLGLNAQAAPFLGQAALQAPGQQLAGAGLAGDLSRLPGALEQQRLGIGAAGSDLFGQLLNVGQLQRGIAQEPLDAARQAQMGPMNILSQFGPLALGTQSFSNFAQQPQPGLGASLMPALGSFLGSPTGSAALGGILGGAGGALGGLGGGIMGGLGALGGLI